MVGGRVHRAASATDRRMVTAMEFWRGTGRLATARHAPVLDFLQIPFKDPD
jgi:hypothetical protein